MISPFSGNGPARRLFFLLASAGLTAAICISHGFSQQRKVTDTLETMIREGRIVAIFWRVERIEGNALVVTRHNRRLTLRRDASGAVRTGDNVSFIARKSPGATGEWKAEALRHHGTSRLKFAVSLLALVLTARALFRGVGVHRETLSLTLSG